MPSTTSKSPRDAARVIALVAALVAASSCGDAVREGTGSAFLVIENLSAASGGGSAGRFDNTLRSDVLTEGSVYEDPGRVTVRLAPKDHTSPLTTNNYVTLTRYRVVFTRSDGRNTQGVDVPYAFDGALTFNVGDDSATGNFVLVRAQSKLEPPLMQLRGQGGAVVISTLAQVTFYGTDQTGHEVTATGTLSVNFADWADPQ